MKCGKGNFNMKKIAHVFKSLSAGGIEKWLTDVAIVNNNIKEFELYYLLQTPEKGFFEEKVKKTSAHINKLDIKKGYFGYLLKLYNDFKVNRYDIVHSHVHHSSGIILLIAFMAGVKIRVAHSHNDKRNEYHHVGLTKKLYFFICKLLIIIFSNRKIAVSDNAAKSLFPYSLKKTDILPCGLNLDVSDVEIKKHSINDKVKIGHIGSFSPQKNHEFICNLAKAMEDEYPGQYEFNLVGHGQLFEEIELLVDKLNIRHCVNFLGLRNDVRELIINEFDIVILPSLHEGLAMVALETQYYGKPLIVSDTLSRQHTFSNYVFYASIVGTNDFSNKIRSIQKVDDDAIYDCRKYLDESPMSVHNNIKELAFIYNK